MAESRMQRVLQFNPRRAAQECWSLCVSSFVAFRCDSSSEPRIVQVEPPAPRRCRANLRAPPPTFVVWCAAAAVDNLSTRRLCHFSCVFILLQFSRIFEKTFLAADILEPAAHRRRPKFSGQHVSQVPHAICLACSSSSI